MLFNTFVHIPGIGETTERRLWQAGVKTWDDFREPYPEFLSAQKAAMIREHLARGRGNVGPVCAQLPASQRWRLFPAFRHSVAYLDIETTGLSFAHSDITTISLYDGADVFTYVLGENLDRFAGDVGRYELLVTYNGTAFDLPMIRQRLGIGLGQMHLDLRPLLQSLGFRGGLKGCERQLGLDRGALAGVDGFFAVLLWREYQRSGDRRALSTLLAYNIEDTVNLEILLVMAYNLKVRETPFAGSHCLPLPRQPRKPFSVDSQLVARLQGGREKEAAQRNDHAGVHPRPRSRYNQE